ncbi:type 12 methyltransferase [Burkholderia pseudomallei]|uniref:class I SAM-dependent methyltransferase n=1 Tax=Burkholderia pseudomallei TaxID=28450 RepID=UPI0005E6C038|nr:class I SAM-dependent methyltransferase [Burkholderia pseudomallei]CAK1314192.1 type 12 methyltransferase [Burkholderia pseudomallei]
MTEDVQASAQNNMGSSKWNLVTRLLGAIDLHYHFRSKPLHKFFTLNDHNPRVRVLEFGCGDGVNLFGLRSRLPALTGVGIDIDPELIGKANKFAAIKGYNKLHFVCADAVEASDAEDASFDYVLLIDVLEHLDNPRALLEGVEKKLRPDGSVLISVPTHRYPRVFGLKYHSAVGHVRDGFNLQELDQLLGPSYKRTQYSYNTGLVASIACACFYRLIPKIPVRKIAILSMISLHLSRLVDVFNGESLSCSLWAVYQRRPS